MGHLSVIDNEDGVKTWRCRCGKEWVGIHFRWNAYGHVDAHHLKHIQHRCNLCDKIFPIHGGLKNHYKADHDQSYRVMYKLKHVDSGVINGAGTQPKDGSFSSDYTSEDTEATNTKKVTKPKKI